ncbi:MAG: cofactor-independent phosphoglycerate mutase [Candidatus Omnitrophica bacterium]|nr:cofactor-independent phosphoglycerate mutase [Candidatus Omnitrophota bacterium]
MKFAVIVPDGLGDWPVAEIGQKTPLEVAKVPHLHDLARKFIMGTVRTVPHGMQPGSDICGLCLMGYDPTICYSGRAPLEAANLGLMLEPGELAFRCNLVNVENDVMVDYSAGHVSTDEARILIEALQKELGTAKVSFHPGKMYRHIMLVKDSTLKNVQTDQPHDFMGESFEKHWPQGRGSELLIELTRKSRPILENHPVNEKRAHDGHRQANMIWLWGGGVAPQLERFKDKFGVQGGVISAVDLLNGIGRYVGWEILTVPGATGYFDTDYCAKGEYAVRALDRLDLVFVHVEATDEAGHAGFVHEKIKAIEQIDRYIVAPVVQRLKKEKEWRLVVAPDHYTPIAKKTHVSDPVPFIFAGSDVHPSSGLSFTEKAAKSTGIHLGEGYLLMSRLIRGWR